MLRAEGGAYEPAFKPLSHCTRGCAASGTGRVPAESGITVFVPFLGSAPTIVAWAPRRISRFEHPFVTSRISSPGSGPWVALGASGARRSEPGFVFGPLEGGKPNPGSISAPPEVSRPNPRSFSRPREASRSNLGSFLALLRGSIEPGFAFPAPFVAQTAPRPTAAPSQNTTSATPGAKFQRVRSWWRPERPRRASEGEGYSSLPSPSSLPPWPSPSPSSGGSAPPPPPPRWLLRPRIS